MNVCTEHGDQRRIHIQLVVNKRRIKRRRKKMKQSVLPLHDRVAYIFENGSILDYTHPKEVDPFWGVLYKQYEYLIYTDACYRCAIKQIEYELSDGEITSIMNDLYMIQMHKKQLMIYMMNFMNVMYGSVIQSRFYGWKQYLDDLISRFNEVAISAIRKLRFDANQTLCSVYFYQAFWLSGLSIVNKISEELKNKYNDDADLNRGNPTFKVDYEDDFDSLFQNVPMDQLEGLSNLDKDIHTSEELNEANACTYEREIELEGSCLEEQYVSNIDIDSDYEVFCSLKKLLHQVGVPIDNIYNMSDSNLNKLGKTIKKEIKKGNLCLSKSELNRIQSLVH